jgi:malonyl-CoA O-methyltransferase
MQPSRKTRIVHAFDRANAYDANAQVQRTVADLLAARIRAFDIDTSAPALEIGCGTGFLTSALLDRWPSLALTASDIAPAMVDRARHLLGDRANVRFDVVDGEDANVAPGSLGLIASSLAFQWFETPAPSIRRLIEALKPGGWLIFSTLIAGSFREWISAQREAGLGALTRDYPDAALFAQIAADDCTMDIRQYRLLQHHRDGLAFLRSLKAIGANARWDDTALSPPGALRHALSLFERQGGTVSYEIAEVAIQRRK